MQQKTLKTALLRAFQTTLVVLTMSVVLSEVVQAQSARPRKFSLGLYGTYGLDLHQANFLDLPNFPVYVQRTGASHEPGPFSNVNAWNPAFGIVMDYMIDERLGVGLRANYATQNATLTTRSTYRVGRSDGTFADAVSQFAISDTLTMIGLEPMVSYNIWEGLFVHLGARLNFVNSAKYYQAETLLEPTDGGFFPGGTIRTRNVSQGDLPNANTFTIAPMVGLSYAINIVERLYVQPEVFFAYGLMPVVRDLQWTVHSLRPGLTVKYKF